MKETSPHESAPGVPSDAPRPTGTPELIEVDMPPAVTVPSPPPGFVEPDMGAFRGCYPSKTELGGAAQAVHELESFSDYAAVFGSAAPPARLLASALEAAIAWRALRDATAAWDSFVRAGDARAWQTASLFLERLKPAFVVAQAANPSLAVEHPGLAQLVNARRQAGKHAKRARKTVAVEPAATAATAPPAPTKEANVAPPAPAVVIQTSPRG